MSNQPAETAKVLCPKTASLLVHLIWHSSMPTLVGRVQQLMHAYIKVLGQLGSMSPRVNITLSMQGIHYAANSLFPTTAFNIILLNGAAHLLGTSFSPFHLVYSLLNFVQACQQERTLQPSARISTQCNWACIWCPEKVFPNPSIGPRIQPRHTSPHPSSTMHHAQLHHQVRSSRWWASA